MATYTSTLPDELLDQIKLVARELHLPKNKLIEKAVSIYLNEYKRAQYIKSFRRATVDKELEIIAEEGMSDYLRSIEKWESDAG